MSSTVSEISKRIKQLALDQGFTACGIAPAKELDKDAIHLRNWLDRGLHAGMQFMENHFDKRIDPGKLVSEAKSVILVLLNYFPSDIQKEEDNFLISKYAYGRDYHMVMKKMLKQFKDKIHTTIKLLEGRIFVDSAPVLERALAAAAGLGWIGKNSNLISPKHGSFVFIGELICDLELIYDKPIPDYCGDCTKCIQACPTKAIVSDRIIDSRKCVSYWTIENKEDINELLRGTFNNRIFGCDICQDVCPWNKKMKSHKVEEFRPSHDLLAMTRDSWQHLTEERFNKLFKESAVKRAGFTGLKRNIKFVKD